MYTSTFLPLLLLPLTSAVNIYWYTSSNCLGSGVAFNGATINSCYAAPGSQVKSLEMVNGVSSQKYQIYSDTSCTSYLGETRGAQDGACLAGNIHSANYFVSSKRLVRKEAEKELTVGVFYHLPEGTRREVKCEFAELEKVQELVKNENWEALAQYDEVVGVTEA